MNTRYLVDHFFFDSLAVPLQAYWLGFLSADGHIADTRISLLLAARDKAHLSLFRKALSSNHPIFCCKHQPRLTWRIDIHSVQLVRALRRLGLARRKSHSLVPLRLPAHLERHYWRGWFDGDGYFYRLASGQWQMGLVGNLSVCESFVAFLSASGLLRLGKINQHGSIFRWRLSGTPAVRYAVVALYGCAGDRLRRKSVIAARILR